MVQKRTPTLGTDGSLDQRFLPGRSRPSHHNERPEPAVGNRLTKVGVVISPGASGAFDDVAVEGLIPMRDPVSGKIAGVYTGYKGPAPDVVASIGLAYSDDGVTWTKAGQFFAHSSNPAARDSAGVTGPVLIYENGLYHLFYIGLDEIGYEGGTAHPIMLATTPRLDDPVWTRRGIVLEPDGDVDWRAIHVWHPSLIKHEGRWVLFCNASAIETIGSNHAEVIGYAQGGTTLLDPFVPDDVNSPVVEPTGDSGTLIWNITGDPFLSTTRDGYRMDFYAVGGDGQGRDFYATCRYENFPVGPWTIANDGQPILSTGAVGDYDEQHNHKPAILELGGRIMHYSTVVGSGGDGPGGELRQIGLATDPRLRPPSTTAVLSTGDYVVSTTDYGIPGGFAKRIYAFPGDRLLVSLSGVVDAGTGALRTDIGVVVSGVTVDWLSGLGSTGRGFPQFNAIGGRFEIIGGSALVEVTEDHIENGQVLLAPLFRADGGSRSLLATTGNSLRFDVLNIG